MSYQLLGQMIKASGFSKEKIDEALRFLGSLGLEPPDVRSLSPYVRSLSPDALKTLTNGWHNVKHLDRTVSILVTDHVYFVRLTPYRGPRFCNQFVSAIEASEYAADWMRGT